MKRSVTAVFVCFFIQAASLYAACKTDACRQAIAWKKGYTAIVLADNISRADYMAVLDAVKANKGVVAIEAERALLGWVPVETAGKIRSVRGVTAVLYQAVPRPSDLVHNQAALDALSYFNRLQTGVIEDEVEAGLAVKGQTPLTGCIMSKSESTAPIGAHTESVPFNRQLDPESLIQPDGGLDRDLPIKVTPKWGWFQTPYHNTQMIGRITVQVFRMDSDGTVDPNTYTWSDADYSYQWDQVNNAFNFWVSQATVYGHTLSFTVRNMDPFSRYKRGYIPTPTQYEPILRPSTDDYLWMNDALARNGYGASPVTSDNVYTQNEALNQAYAADPTYGPFDGSFSVYVVYNPGSAPSTFSDNVRAFTRYLGGPSSVVMWNSAGWQPQNLGLVLTHETGHIFWACDEYYNSGDGTGCLSCYYCAYNVGPRNQVQTPWVTNQNCDNPTATGTCDVPRVSCIMRDQSQTLCPHTPGQIGW